MRPVSGGRATPTRPARDCGQPRPGVRGELTGASEEALTEAWTRAADPMTRRIVLDFTELDYMNSTGIGQISFVYP